MPKKLLIPMEQYLSSGIRIGSKFKTKYMEEYIYKIRPDGLALLDANSIDERLEIAAKFMSRFDPKQIIVVCRRDVGANPLKLLGEATGMHVVFGRYFPGTLTNVSNEFFKESKLMLVCDPWVDRNAIEDAMKVGIPIMAICDTNNTKNNVDFVIPGNNKGKKSLGTILWIIAKEYLKSRGEIKSDKDFKYSVDDFVGKQ
jgi:small subunit ribosomal protein S2